MTDRRLGRGCMRAAAEWLQSGLLTSQTFQSTSMAAAAAASIGQGLAMVSAKWTRKRDIARAGGKSFIFVLANGSIGRPASQGMKMLRRLETPAGRKFNSAIRIHRAKIELNCNDDDDAPAS